MTKSGKPPFRLVVDPPTPSAARPIVVQPTVSHDQDKMIEEAWAVDVSEVERTLRALESVDRSDAEALRAALADLAESVACLTSDFHLAGIPSDAHAERLFALVGQFRGPEEDEDDFDLDVMPDADLLRHADPLLDLSRLVLSTARVAEQHPFS